METSDTWRRLCLLQIAASLPAMASTVLSKQYVLPYALSFASLTLTKKPAESGLELGLFVGSFGVGRALMSPIWRLMGKWCGLRATFQVGLLLQVILTLGFGLVMDFWIATAIRFALGMASPGLALAPETLMKQVIRHYNEVPMATVVTTLVHGSVLAFGIMLGALDIRHPEMPYLASSLVVVIVSLVAFSVLSVDFLEAEEIPKKQIYQRQSLHFQRFVGESTPKLPHIDSNSSEPPADFARFPDDSTPLPALIILKNVISVEMLNGVNQTTIEDQQEAQDTNGSERDGKRTHISFLSEDFQQAGKGPAAKAKEVGLDLEMHASESLCTAEYLLALGLYAGLVGVFGAVESAGMMWLGIQDYCQGQKCLGMVLAGVLMNVLVITMLMSSLTRSLSIHTISLLGLLGFTLGGVAFPYVSLLRSREIAVSAAFLSLVIRDCGVRLCLTGLVMRLSSSVKPETRGRAMFWADITASLVKGLAMVAGPTLLSVLPLFIGYIDHWMALFPLCMSVLGGLLLYNTQSKYPLLAQVPYPI